MVAEGASENPHGWTRIFGLHVNAVRAGRPALTFRRHHGQLRSLAHRRTRRQNSGRRPGVGVDPISISARDHQRPAIDRQPPDSTSQLPGPWSRSGHISGGVRYQHHPGHGGDGRTIRAWILSPEGPQLPRETHRAVESAQSAGAEAKWDRDTAPVTFTTALTEKMVPDAAPIAGDKLAVVPPTPTLPRIFRSSNRKCRDCSFTWASTRRAPTRQVAPQSTRRWSSSTAAGDDVVPRSGERAVRTLRWLSTPEPKALRQMASATVIRHGSIVLTARRSMTPSLRAGVIHRETLAVACRSAHGSRSTAV